MTDERKPFLLRVPPQLLEDLRRWADAEMRSLNGQIEWLLRQALRQHRRGKPNADADPTESDRR